VRISHADSVGPATLRCPSAAPKPRVTAIAGAFR
jgi:hypothetical protein